MADKNCKYKGESNEFCGYVKNCEDCDRFNCPAANNAATETIRTWHDDHFNTIYPVLFVKQLASAGLTTENIAAVLSTLDDICQNCWDDDRDCRCWDDS